MNREQKDRLQKEDDDNYAMREEFFIQHYLEYIKGRCEKPNYKDYFSMDEIEEGKYYQI